MIYVVLGMHCGGTSLVAKLLQHWGITMSDPGANLCEDISCKRLNKLIIEEAGGSWQNPSSEESIFITGEGYKDAMERALTVNRPEFWGFKDPRTILTWSVWQQVLGKHDHQIIKVIRTVSGVTDCLKRRGDVIAEPRDLVMYHYELMREIPGDYIVNFDALRTRGTNALVEFHDYIGFGDLDSAQEIIIWK